METNDRQKSWLKVWGGRLLNMIFFFCMLFVVYLVSGVFIVTSFKIPSDSMEPSIIRKSKFPQNPKRSVRFSGKRTKRSVQKRKARNTQKAETKVL